MIHMPYDNYLGTLEMGAARRGSPMRRGASAGPRVPRAVLVPDVPGSPASGLRLQPLGLGTATFSNTSGTILSISASPQRPFKPQRLVVDLSRTGASSTGLVTVNRIDVGSDNQLIGSSPLPVAAFSATAVDCNLSFAPATPGILITVQLAISSAPTTTDTVVCAGMMLGTSFN
jgi:hypothetical protein